MRRPALCLVLALAACSKPVPKEDREPRMADVAAPSPAMEAADVARQGPGIAPTAAPGVAFNYRYAFRLQDARISQVQEQHATMCEKLGVARCRITGLRYRLRDKDDVEAFLALKLAPDIARAFGKDAIAAVQRAEGMVVDTEISGEDAGADIASAERDSGRLRDEIARIEARLAKSGLSGSERGELTAQAETLREQLRALAATKSEAREKLANTPMTLTYGSGDVIPGFDGATPLRDAARQAWASFVSMIGIILVIVAALAPWATLGALAWAIGLPLRRRWAARAQIPPTP